MASIDAIERKPEALAAFVAGATRAAHWANDNPKDAALASAKLLPDVSLDLLQAAADAHTKSKFYNFDVVYSPEDFRFMYDSSVALGQMKPGMKYEDFFDPRPIAAARRM
jgi:ABC-type nitrate/sulfonate/bicarbonate transport system substrate-binding protein